MIGRDSEVSRNPSERGRAILVNQTLNEEVKNKRLLSLLKDKGDCLVLARDLKGRIITLVGEGKIIESVRNENGYHEEWRVWELKKVSDKTRNGKIKVWDGREEEIAPFVDKQGMAFVVTGGSNPDLQEGDLLAKQFFVKDSLFKEMDMIGLLEIITKEIKRVGSNN